MILTDEQVQERIESPSNLLNRLRRTTATLKLQIPSLPAPKAADLVDDLEDKIRHGTIRQKAADIMHDALEELKISVKSVKPEKLAQIVREMNTVVTSRENEDKEKTTQVIVYAPQIRSEQDFDTVVVRE